MENVIITIVVALIVCGLIFLFYLRVKHERNHNNNSIPTVRNYVVGDKEFSMFLNQCLQPKNKDKFLYVLRIADLEHLSQNYDEKEMSHILKQIDVRCQQVFGKQVTIHQNKQHDFYLLNKRTILTDEAKEICEMLIIESSRPMVMADAYKQKLSVNICAVNMEKVSDMDVLIKQIDASLLKLAETKENSYEFIDAEVNAKDIQHFEFYKLLQNAVEQKAVELKFCPVVELDTMKISRLDCQPNIIVDGKKTSPDVYDKVLVQSPEMSLKELCIAYGEILKQRLKWNSDFGTTDYDLALVMYQAQLTNLNLIDDLRQLSRMYSINNKFQVFEIEDTKDHNLLKYEKTLELLYRMGYKLYIKNFDIEESAYELINKDYIAGMDITIEEIKNALEHPIKKLTLNMIMSYCENSGKPIVATNISGEEDISRLKEVGIKYAKGKFVKDYVLPNKYKKLKLEKLNDNEIEESVVLNEQDESNADNELKTDDINKDNNNSTDNLENNNSKNNSDQQDGAN